MDVRHGHVVVTSIPYVIADRTVERGTMLIPLTESGERTGPPPDHTVLWAGTPPCHHSGKQISSIYNGPMSQQVGQDLRVEHRFSSKPASGRYDDYYHQFVSYIAVISHEAQALDPDATAKTFAPLETREDESVHRYWDTATTRAGIGMANGKLEVDKVAIVGLGGSGSYVLDLVVKAPIGEIHLFDGVTCSTTTPSVPPARYHSTRSATARRRSTTTPNCTGSCTGTSSRTPTT